MQHWVLCELLGSAHKHFNYLTYVDAHSMAPIACNRTSSDCKFDTVFNGLPGQKSLYEQAWHALSRGPGTYPNSANFVKQLWRPFSNCRMLLCETGCKTVSLLRSWKSQLDSQNISSLNIEIAAGDWRTRFEKGLPKPEGLTFIAFDPCMFNRHLRIRRAPENMYPDDLRLLIEKTPCFSKILIQLSTYSVNDDNSQEQVIKKINSMLLPNEFEDVAIVKPSNSMMSLIYQRGLDSALVDELTSLSRRFKKWFASI